MSRRPLAGRLLVAGLLGWLLAGPAGAHAFLAASDPPDGATVAEPPGEIRLEFNEPVGTEFAQVQVTGPDAVRLEVGGPAFDAEVLTQAITQPTKPGVHAVVYRVVSRDGHPIEGRLTFEFAPTPAEEPPAEEPLATPELDQPGRGVQVAARVARFVNDGSLAAVLGLLLAAVWLLPAAGSRRRAARIAGLAAVVWLLSAALLFVLALANAAALPVADVLDPARLAAFARTRFGGMVLAQGLLAGCVAALALSAPRTALVVAGLGALGPPLWGHAATARLAALAIPAGWVHVLGAGAWVGGLAALVVLAGRGEGLRLAASRFSRLAGWAILAVGASGLVHLALHTEHLGQLTTTSWGRLALVKVGLLGVLAGFGFLHRRRTLPALAHGGPAAFRRFAGVELAVMLMAVGLAATMASGMPASVEAAARIKSLATPFGAGQLNLVIDPGVPGPNEVHLYFFDAGGDPQPVDEPAVVFEGQQPVDARLFTAGTGHFVDPRLELRAGSYRAVITGRVDGGEQRATATVTLP